MPDTKAAFPILQCILRHTGTSRNWVLHLASIH